MSGAAGEQDLKVQGLSTLPEAMRDFLKKEALTGDNQYECTACGTKVDAARGIELVALPQVLHLHLMRFVYDLKTFNRKKVQSPVTFPKELDMAEYCDLKDKPRKKAKGANGAAAACESPAGAGSCVYELQAVVLHSGPSAISGHYISHVRDEESGRWWRFDDEEVSSLAEDEFFGDAAGLARARKKRKPKDAEALEGQVRSKEAYMLIYRRKPDGGAGVGAEEQCPSQFREEIAAESSRLLALAEAEETAHRTDREKLGEHEEVKEEIFRALPLPAGEAGFFLPTRWLRHWVDFDPLGGTCDKVRPRACCWCPRDHGQRPRDCCR